MFTKNNIQNPQKLETVNNYWLRRKATVDFKFVDKILK